MTGRISGSSRSLPIGWRVDAVMLALVASRMNFIQRSVRICSLSVASKPAFWHSASSPSPRLLRLPSSSPKIMRMKVPTWWITPGLMMEAEICATPPITASRPRIGSRRSAASMPFCSGITAVSGPISGLMCSPALSTSHSLTQNSTMSTLPMLGGIVGRLRRHQMGIAARAVHSQALALHRGEMRAARDEGDVGACLRQCRAKSASDAAGADHRNPHQFLPATFASAPPFGRVHVAGSM